MTAPHGSAVLNEKPLKPKEKLTRTVGAGLTSFAMALYIYSFGPITSSQVSVPKQSQTTKIETSQVLAAEEKIDNTFSIYIPFLQAKSEVYGNIDPFDEKDYSEALQKGVAQAKGTGMPGEGKRIFMFAHSTNSILNIARYNAIFYDLGKVPNGETVDIYFHGKVYQYRVTGKIIVEADDVSWLTPKDGEELILQTCYPPGTSWKRELLFAKPA